MIFEDKILKVAIFKADTCHEQEQLYHMFICEKSTPKHSHLIFFLKSLVTSTCKSLEAKDINNFQ